MIRALPPALRPAPWRSRHTLAALVTLVIGVLILLFPVNAAATAGQFVTDKENTLYVHAGLTGMALWVGLVIRGHPWWHTVICLLIAGGMSGQMLRAVYNPEIRGLPTSLMLLDLALGCYLVVLAVRPNVYERLHECEAELKRLRGER